MSPREDESGSAEKMIVKLPIDDKHPRRFLRSVYSIAPIASRFGLSKLLRLGNPSKWLIKSALD
jgi:hypothetical protein